MDANERLEFIRQLWKENRLEQYIPDFMDRNVIQAIIYDEALPPATYELVQYQARKRLGKEVTVFFEGQRVRSKHVKDFFGYVLEVSENAERVHVEFITMVGKMKKWCGPSDIEPAAVDAGHEGV